MTINKISFGNTFHLYSRSIVEAIKQDEFIENLPQDRGILTSHVYAKNTPLPVEDAYLKNIIIAGDNKDIDISVKEFCEMNGILYDEFSQGEVLDLKAIKDRVVTPETSTGTGFTLVEVDSKKLDMLVKKQSNNFGQAQQDWKRHRKLAQINVNSADEITAPILYISASEDFKKQNLKAPWYLDEGVLSFQLTQKDDLNNHITYFELKKMGMRYIPMAIDKNTKEILDSLGVIKKG